MRLLFIQKNPWQQIYRILRSQTTTGQFLRFCIVGSCNAALDLAILNSILLAFPTKNMIYVLIYNSFAVLIAGTSSFVCNKYWTFRRDTNITWIEVWRFIILMTFMTALNDSWFAVLSHFFATFAQNQTIGGNILKCVAIIGTMLFSFMGQKLWVFYQLKFSERSTLFSDYETEKVPAVKQICDVDTVIIRSINPIYDVETMVMNVPRIQSNVGSIFVYEEGK